MARRVIQLLWCLAVLAASLACAPVAYATEPRVVLVASARSPIASLSANEARRLYLGLPLVHDGHELTPLRNGADAAVHEMFLQRVMFMSAQAYERQMSTRVYRSGGNRAREYTSHHELAQALAGDPWAVSYMTSDAVAKESSLKIVGTP